MKTFRSENKMADKFFSKFLFFSNLMMQVSRIPQFKSHNTKFKSVTANRPKFTIRENSLLVINLNYCRLFVCSHYSSFILFRMTLCDCLNMRYFTRFPFFHFLLVSLSIFLCFSLDLYLTYNVFLEFSSSYFFL